MRTVKACCEWRYCSVHSYLWHSVQVTGSLNASLATAEWNESSCTHLRGGWVGPRSVQDAAEKSKVSSVFWKIEPSYGLLVVPKTLS